MTYRRDHADVVCELMAEGMSLREICAAHRKTDPSFPAPSTVRKWVVHDVDGMGERYARARLAQADHWADEILEIAENGSNDWIERRTKKGELEIVLDREHVQRSTLRVDARKWLLAKLHPEIYGERVHNVHTGANGGPIKHQDVPADPRVSIETFLEEWSNGKDDRSGDTDGSAVH